MFDIKATSLRLQVVGLSSSSATQIAALVQKWVSCNGEEETVKRIKSIKTNLLRHYAGLPPLLNQGVWIKYRSEGPKGPFGVLFRLSRKNFRTAWNAIMVYTQLVYHSSELWATEEQWKNFIASVTREPVAPSALVQGLAVVHRSPLKLKIDVPEKSGTPLVDYQVSDSKRAPLVTGYKNAPEPKTLVDSLQVLEERASWATENWDILSGTCEGLQHLIMAQIEHNAEVDLRTGVIPSEERPRMGTISLIQEGGYKLRFAANPYRVYQAALQPLGRALFRALRTISQDCTFDHDKGVRKVQEWLGKGYPAVSMDLSNATDRAPLDLQLAFLARCGVPTRWIQFLASTCKGDWVVNRSRTSPYTRRVIRWSVGSPLGLYPTFATFALWHHCVVQAAFADCGRFPSGEYPYVILGDDLVICDYEVASVVRDWFLSWGMKVSDSKGLISDSVAEFAGRVISSSDVTRGFKWKGPISDESFVSFAANFGPGSLMMMRPRHKRVLAFIGDLPEPYGLGWNPHGIPLEERLTQKIEAVWDRDERYRTFSSRAERINRALYQSDHLIGVRKDGELVDFNADTSDQEAEEVVRAMLPGLSGLGAAIWPNLPTVALSRGVPEEVSSLFEAMLKRVSQLEPRTSATMLVILERKIRAVLSRSV